MKADEYIYTRGGKQRASPRALPKMEMAGNCFLFAFVSFFFYLFPPRATSSLPPKSISISLSLARRPPRAFSSFYLLHFAFAAVKTHQRAPQWLMSSTPKEILRTTFTPTQTLVRRIVVSSESESFARPAPGLRQHTHTHNFPPNEPFPLVVVYIYIWPWDICDESGTATYLCFIIAPTL